LDNYVVDRLADEIREYGLEKEWQKAGKMIE